MCCRQLWWVLLSLRPAGLSGVCRKLLLQQRVRAMSCLPGATQSQCLRIDRSALTTHLPLLSDALTCSLGSNEGTCTSS